MTVIVGADSHGFLVVGSASAAGRSELVEEPAPTVVAAINTMRGKSLASANIAPTVQHLAAGERFDVQPGTKMIEERIPGSGLHRLQRRAVVKAALAGVGGLVGSGLLPGGDLPARAQVLGGGSLTPAIGRITKSGVPAVQLVEFAAPPRTSSVRPYADLNYLLHRGDGTARMFACDSRGKLWSINSGTGAATLALEPDSISHKLIILSPAGARVA